MINTTPLHTLHTCTGVQNMHTWRIIVAGNIVHLYSRVVRQSVWAVSCALCAAALPVLAPVLPGPDQYLLAGRGDDQGIRDTDKPS